MKILIVGTFLPGRLEFSYERAFNLLGCTVKCFDMGYVNRFLQSSWQYLVNKRFYNACDNFKPDLTFVIKGYYLWSETINKLKRSSRPLIFCFNTDNPFNISCGMSNKNILNSISFYDCYFIWSKLLVERLFKRGAKRVEYLPFGVDAHLHFPVNVSDHERQIYSNDVVFVGNWDKERERWFKELVSLNLGLWGSHYWARRCKNRKLRRKWRHKEAIGSEMSKVLNSSKISLNILRVQNKGSHNMRTFELPACRAFVLAERSPEAEEFFKEGKEAVYFSTPEELKEKIRYYLTHEQERGKIAQAGYQRCISSGYTYMDRAKQVLKIYEKLSREQLA